MKDYFREHHLFEILTHYQEQGAPLDLFLRNYFKRHRAVGSKDRKWICETLYTIIRWQDLFDYLTQKQTWQSRAECALKLDVKKFLHDATIPPHIRVSFPKPFFEFLEKSLGFEKAWEFCVVSNEPAPTTIRVNTLKTTRDALLARLSPLYRVSACRYSSTGIIFEKRENFFGMPEFKEGLFEVQDEASQLIADLINPTQTNHVLDFCAGSGGKTLAFAPKMHKRGQIFVHDIRPSVLLEARKRLKRAGIQNAQLLMPDSPQKEKLHQTMDWVLVDAPCSGTGTLRRNPDMKRKFSCEMVSRLIQEQRAIFQEALKFLKPKGRIVYATCSILPQENDDQIAYFEQQHGLRQIGSPLRTFPQSGGMDGFFGTVLEIPKSL